MIEKNPVVYMMASKFRGVIYVGVTSDLVKRVYQHKYENGSYFTSHYLCKRLVYFEQFGSMEYAIEREKQLKAGCRSKKIALIEKENPEWQDLYETII